LYPKLASKINNDGSMYTPALEDLSPLLQRGEFKDNMLIKAVSRSKKIFESN